MAQAHAFSLALYQSATEHLEVQVFHEYRVVVDMLRAGNEWSFTLWNSSVGDGAFRQLRRAVRLGARAVFSIDGAPQLAGPIEDAELMADRAGGLRLLLKGRDAAATAIDWDADPKVSVRGRAVGDVVADILNRVGIEVQPTTGAAATAAQGRPRSGGRGVAAHPRRQRIDLAHARPGERAWGLVQEVCKRVGLLAWVAPDPESLTGMWVVLDVPAYESAPVFTFRRVVRDGVVVANPDLPDVLDSTFRVSIRDVPTRVEAYGRAARGDEPAGRLRHVYTNDLLARFSEVVSPLPPHPRFLHGRRIRSLATAKQEAARCIAEGMAGFRTYACTVQGHGQRVGGQMRLYTVNTMARVEDGITSRHGADEGGPRGEDMLITRVEFRGDRTGGQTTALTLGAKGAIPLVPEAS